MENKNLKEQILRSYDNNPLKCMGCGKCSATCPNFDNMEYHPHQFVSMVNKGRIEKLLESLHDLNRSFPLKLIVILCFVSGEKSNLILLPLALLYC